jgi:hypothetical protein
MLKLPIVLRVWEYGSPFGWAANAQSYRRVVDDHACLRPASAV